jgi:ribosomal protein S18 acetylase RimI-like enzyme
MDRGITCDDWRDVAPGEIATLMEIERRRWIDALRWDMTASFAIIEQGRRAGHVPGWIARDARGVAHGWSYYILHDGTLQIGGVVATRPAVARRLIDAIMHSTEADLARRVSCFLFPEGPSIASAFERQRFALSETRYLGKSLERDDDRRGVSLSMLSTTPVRNEHVANDGARDARAMTIRPWRDTDLAPTVRLLAAAYRGVPGASCFAPDGGLDQWAQYAGQLTRVPACGAFDPALSFVAAGASPAELLGVVMGTRLSDDTAHIAQIAVAPSARRSGLARQLLAASFAAASAASLTSVTLMVDAGNAAASSLYADLGFLERARFLYGRRAARTRVAA